MNEAKIAVVSASKAFAERGIVPPGWREILTPKRVSGLSSFQNFWVTLVRKYAPLRETNRGLLRLKLAKHGCGSAVAWVTIGGLLSRRLHTMTSAADGRELPE